MYGGRYAEVYDLVMRHRDRDYEREARALLDLVDDRRGPPETLLDVACGTGLHLRTWHHRVPHVVGLDASDAMLAVARKRIHGLRTRTGDMRTLDLAQRFDMIVCMFAAPHLSSSLELTTTLTRLAAHLTSDGVLVVEPWYRPEQFIGGYISEDVVHDDGRTVVRLSHSIALREDPHRIRMSVHHVEADPARGIAHTTESVTMSLFTDADYVSAFAAAGCTAEHLGIEPFTWGLWVARRR